MASLISDTVDHKFVEVFDVNDWEVETDTGWKSIVATCKTIPYKVWSFVTDNHFLKCADDHIVFRPDYTEVFVKDLNIGDEILTDTGIEKISEIYETDIEENMYDLQVESEEHRLYTNGILSHNTTVATIAILWLVMFQPDFQVGILSYKSDGAKDIMTRIKLAYKLLPNWLKTGVTEWNAMSINFENGSRIEAGTTTEDSFTGQSLNLLVFDEVAKVRPSLFEHLYASIFPTISSGKTTRIMMFSTPKGINHWWNICNEARNGINGYAFFTIEWNDVPGRDDEWREQQIKKIGEKKFAQEFQVEFLGSSQTLIESTGLKKLAKDLPIHSTEHYRIYAPYDPTRTYVAGIDASRGLEQDYHVIQVVDITQFPFKQVAVFEANEIGPSQFVAEAVDFLKFYNSPTLFVENNDVGCLVTDRLFHDYEYEDLYWGDKEIGIKTGGKTKHQMLMTLKDLIENEKIIINDQSTINQFYTFVRTKGSYAAEEGNNDDLVMGLAFATYILRTDLIDMNHMTQRIINKSENFNDDTLDPVSMPDGYGDPESFDNTNWLQ